LAFDISLFARLFKQVFPHDLTADQRGALNSFVRFISKGNSQSIFILTGYAGTGKSSLLAHVIKALKGMKIQSVLLAPTGRAAKVLGTYAGESAYTIHKQIYFSENELIGNRVSLAPNRHKHTLFFVDEASMLAGFDPGEGGNVLEDLMTYVQNGHNCRLIFIGDSGQLPPVGQDISPVFSLTYWKENFPFITVVHASLKEVVRTDHSSSVLTNATFIRSKIDYEEPFFIATDQQVQRVEGLEIQDKLESAFDESGIEECMVVTLSNKRANKWNLEIRNRLLYREEMLERGDRLMVVKNNYSWLDPTSPMGFIANGEMFTVRKVRKLEEIYGFHFAHLDIEFTESLPNEELSVIVHLETLLSESANLSRARMKELFFEVEKDFMYERNKQKRFQKVVKSPYFNALQVKYAYAVTVHKAQGGQWEQVFVDYGFLPDEMKDYAYVRWLYTAITRSKGKLYLVNFPESFFEETNLIEE
jgi:exodeoxyribonuclease-5